MIFDFKQVKKDLYGARFVVEEDGTKRREAKFDPNFWKRES